MINEAALEAALQRIRPAIQKEYVTQAQVGTIPCAQIEMLTDQTLTEWRTVISTAIEAYLSASPGRDCRAEFEIRFSELAGWVPTRFENGDYRSNQAQFCWKLWQAAWKAPAVGGVDDWRDIRVALKASGLSHWAWRAMQVPAALSPEENASELHSLLLDRAAEMVAKVLSPNHARPAQTAPSMQRVREALKEAAFETDCDGKVGPFEVVELKEALALLDGKGEKGEG